MDQRPPSGSQVETRVLILAPRGRDAAIAADLLSRSSIATSVCLTLANLVGMLNAGVGAVILTEEALAAGEHAALASWVAGQPTWSDLTFIVLANGDRGPRSARSADRLADLGNIVLLDRPLHAEAMLGAVRSALKARRRQYQVRAAAETLEAAVIQRTHDLEAARANLEIALDAAGMGSWDIDLATGASTGTLRHDQIFGYAEPQPGWTVKRFLSHVDPAERAVIADVFVHAPAAGLLDFECTIIDALGRRRCIAVKGRVRHDAAGAPTRMTGVVSDITDRKAADEQLAQSQKMDAIGQLTGGVAHDFNNLLTPIVGSFDILRRRHKDDERSQKLVEGGLQAAERAATLTHRLLAFARRQALQPMALDVGALIDGMAELIRRSLGPSIDIVLDIPHQLPAARADPNQLELALLNLAINARDAMPRGGRLTIAARLDAAPATPGTGLQPGSYIRITATDTGTGMDAATLARATEPFFSTKGIGKGTGLGLSMAHGLAAQSGGTLRLSSELGRGTAIELWLPATDVTPAGTLSPRAEPERACHPANILLVDDEELVRTATADMLRDLGYRVTEAGSARQAVAAIRAGLAADAVVTDYLMPGTNGAALIKELRTTGCTLPMLLITGYAATGDDVPPDVARLSKPFRQVDLAARVATLVKTTGSDPQDLRAASR